MPRSLKLRTSFLSCPYLLYPAKKSQELVSYRVLTVCILFRQCHVLWSVCISFSGFGTVINDIHNNG